MKTIKFKKIEKKIYKEKFYFFSFFFRIYEELDRGSPLEPVKSTAKVKFS